MQTPSIAILALLLAGCGDKGNETGTTPTGSPTETNACGAKLVGQDLPTSLYSIWGTSATDVWTVGGDDGSGPMVLHWDGADWSRVATGSTGDLWWVWGSGADDLWFSGRDGRVIHHVPSAGSFDEVTAVDAGLVLFGLWGSSPTDIWTVGGSVDGTNRGVIAHYDGTDWTVPANAPALSGAVYKVWGSGADDVWFVGAGCQIFHFDGTDFTQVDCPFATSTDLLTVSGCGDEVIAVGGFGNGKAARTTDGVTWVDDSPPQLDIPPPFIGVSVSCDHDTLAVGGDLGIWQRGADGWAPQCSPPFFGGLDYHNVWQDPDGGIWAAGGNLDAGTNGAFTYDGPQAVSPISL